MNIYDPYPDEVEVDGRVYQLNMAYDRVLRVLDIQDMQDLTAADKIEIQARLLLADETDLPKRIETQAKLITAALELIPKNPESNSSERFIDFHQDAALIRSAFFRIGVDLLREPIHIQQFLELLADLPSDTALMRTIEIRQRPLPKPTKENQEQLAALQKAKAKVAIRLSEDERRAQFAESLKRSTIMRG